MNAPTSPQANMSGTHNASGGSMDQWIERTRGRSTPRFRLFCFPYAGGNAAMFRDWAEELGLSVEVCALRLPGRERRYSEPSLRRAADVVEHVVPILQQSLGLPFVMFGYSMGALLAYEVARGLLASAGIEPRALFVSAHSAPHLPMRRRNWHDLARDELIAELKALNGTPAEVFENEDLVDLVLPMLRSDLELVESYVQPVGPMLSCPVVAMGGTKDLDVTADELNGWSSVSTGSFKSTMLEGDHFFINSERTLFLDTIRRELVRLGLE